MIRITIVSYHIHNYFFERRLVLLSLDLYLEWRRNVFSFFLGLFLSTLAREMSLSNILSEITLSEGPASVACFPVSTSAQTV